VKITTKLAAITTSLLLASIALLLFALLWFARCPDWFTRFQIPCDLIVGVSYFAICPTLAMLAVGFSVRDLTRKGQRMQAAAALFMSLGLTAWYWTNRSNW
jgi:hypothetical protein